MNVINSRNKIINATVEIIGKEKNITPTVREIASRADVNTAAINYYFRSKENLFTEAEAMLASMLMEHYHLLEKESHPVRERLMKWAEAMMKFILEYPGILYVLGIKVFEKEGQSLGGYVQTAEEKLLTVLKEAFPDQKDKWHFKVQQLMACVIYPVLIQSGVSLEKMFDLSDDQQREQYLNALLDQIFN